jgi:hypothetical protein
MEAAKTTTRSKFTKEFAWLAVFLLLAVTLDASTSQAPSALGQRRANTWAARSSSGLMLGGTWTITEHLKTGGVTGAWALLDAQGRTVMIGGWSAAKTANGWTGSWRAAASGKPGEYTGTWTAKVDLKPAGGFAELFAKAAEAAVSGIWRAGPQSGAWTIQVFN